MRKVHRGNLPKYVALTLTAALTACGGGADENDAFLDDLPFDEELPIDVVNRDVNNDGVEERWTPDFGQLAKVESRPRGRSLECHGRDGVILLN